MNVYLAGLLAYSALLIGVGAVASRRVKAAPDFLVASRRLGPGLLFATFLAANLGAGSTVGATGLGYRLGMSAWWWVGSAAIGTFVLAMLPGPRLWRIAREHSLHTLGDFLEWRYNKAVKAVIALLLCLGTLALLAAQLIAVSWILNVVMGLPKWAGCAAGAVVAIAYCSAGGLIANAFVNSVELAVTLSGFALAVPFALRGVGGWAGLVRAVSAPVGGSAALFSFTGAGLKQILAYLAILVPSFIVSPGLAQKLYGARDEGAVRLGVGLNALGQAAFAFIPAVLGLCALAAYPRLGNPELALPTVMINLLPKWLGIWALASIFSAELSAIGAILFMLSTSMAVDLYKTFLDPRISDRGLLTLNRATVAIAGVLGMLLAVSLPSVIAAVTIFYGLLAVSLFAPVMLGLYWRGATSGAALAGIVSAVGADLLARRFAGGGRLGVFSPELIGIGAAFAVMALAGRMKQREGARHSFPSGKGEII